MNNLSVLSTSKKIYSLTLLEKNSVDDFPGKWDLIIAFYTIFSIANGLNSPPVMRFFVLLYSFWGSYIGVYSLNRFSQLKGTVKEKSRKYVVLLILTAIIFTSWYSFLNVDGNRNKDMQISLVLLLLAHSCVLTLYNWFWIAYNDYKDANSVLVKLKTINTKTVIELISVVIPNLIFLGHFALIFFVKNDPMFLRQGHL